MKIKIRQAVAAHQGGRLEEAEQLYRSIAENQPTNLHVNINLGILLHDLGRFDEAEASYKKAIELKPNHAEVYFNLGITLKKLDKLNEAEASYKKAIELKPNYVEAYFNLGNTLKSLNKYDEAEASYKKAIELKPNYVEAHNNLGFVSKNLGRLDEAETSYRKVLGFKPNSIDAHDNLDLVLEQKKLLSKIGQTKKSVIKNKIILTENPFISNLKVEVELISQLYKINSKKLDDVDSGYLRYGNGRSSDYKLFKNNLSIIKTVEKDLIEIMKKAVKSDIFIVESFFNIFQTKSGIISHNHIGNFDNIYGLLNHKFSLTYYLDVGDQNCSEPGTLKLQDPDKEILPAEGMIVIFPANRKHSAVYNGKKDRVMIGVNFYSLND